MPALQTRIKDAFAQARLGVTAAEQEAGRVFGRIADAAGFTPVDVRRQARELGEKLGAGRKALEERLATQRKALEEKLGVRGLEEKVTAQRKALEEKLGARRKVLEDLVGAQRRELEGKLGAAVQKAKSHLLLPTRGEVETLKARVDALSLRLDELDRARAGDPREGNA